VLIDMRLCDTVFNFDTVEDSVPNAQFLEEFLHTKQHGTVTYKLQLPTNTYASKRPTYLGEDISGNDPLCSSARRSCIGYYITHNIEVSPTFYATSLAGWILQFFFQGE
jgi:hypothetical protein